MTARRHCLWETAGRRPYFANLKVMREALASLRDELSLTGGELLAYVFLEDRVALLAEGPAEGLGAALDRARAGAGAAFEADNGEPLWGDQRDEEVTRLPPDEAVAPLLRLPVDAGLASTARDYPWLGGEWLLSRP